jgi:hypothetical protein
MQGVCLVAAGVWLVYVWCLLLCGWGLPRAACLLVGVEWRALPGGLGCWLVGGGCWALLLLLLMLLLLLLPSVSHIFYSQLRCAPGCPGS